MWPMPRRAAICLRDRFGSSAFSSVQASNQRMCSGGSKRSRTIDTTVAGCRSNGRSRNRPRSIEIRARGRTAGVSKGWTGMIRNSTNGRRKKSANSYEVPSNPSKWPFNSRRIVHGSLAADSAPPHPPHELFELAAVQLRLDGGQLADQQIEFSSLGNRLGEIGAVLSSSAIRPLS